VTFSSLPPSVRADRQTDSSLGLLPDLPYSSFFRENSLRTIGRVGEESSKGGREGRHGFSPCVSLFLFRDVCATSEEETKRRERRGER